MIHTDLLRRTLNCDMVRALSTVSLGSKPIIVIPVILIKTFKERPIEIKLVGPWQLLLPFSSLSVIVMPWPSRANPFPFVFVKATSEVVFVPQVILPGQEDAGISTVSPFDVKFTAACTAACEHDAAV